MPPVNATEVDRMSRRALLLLGLLALLAAGCGQGQGQPATAGGGQPTAATYTASGQAGTPAWNRDVLYVATPGVSTTRVLAVAASSHVVLRETTIPGRWVLPAIGLARVPDGLSGDGSTLVLQEVGGSTGLSRTASPGSPARSAGRHLVSRFALLDSAMRQPAKLVTLHGWFEYDAVSPDGATLFLIEHLAAGDLSRYRVRAYDVAARRLDEQVIVDKRELDEAAMQGLPDTRVSDGTWAFTLYRSPKGPFIHALRLTDKLAVCIDLPATARSSDRVARLWTLTSTADQDPRSGGERYHLAAVNPALGLTVRIRFADDDPFGYTITTATVAG
jgi:hypothetical protein